LRAEMGHPQPFNLKLLGVGNEQWGTEYVERHEVFLKAIRAKYPEIKIVSSAGPSPDDDRFRYLWAEMSRSNVNFVDEHYYRSPEWFLANANRYDNYQRTGPKVFAGEYAAHGPSLDYPTSANTWLSALAEAALMTGLERNADVVTMCSYAPLLAHTEAWQWRPDLIWFDNLNVVRTPNYYVQKIFSNCKGKNVVPVTLNKLPLTGQDSLYASATTDPVAGKIYVKLVNVSANKAPVTLDISSKATLSKTVNYTLLHHPLLLSFNTFENPTNIEPVDRTTELKGKKLEVVLEPRSFTVFEITYQSAK